MKTITTLLIITATSLMLSFGVNAAQASAASPASLPTKYFSRLPMFEAPRLSPNGKKIAFVHNSQEQGVAILVVQDLASKEQQHLLASDNEKISVNWFDWANEQTLIASVRYASKRYGVDTLETRLLAIDAGGKDKELKPLLKPRRVAAGQKNYSQFQDNVIDMLPDDPDHVLLSIDLDKHNEPSVYRLNVNTQKMKRIERPARLIRNWITDQQSLVRAGERLNFKTGEAAILVRQPGEKKWTTLFAFNAFNEPEIRGVGFDVDPNIFYYRRYKDDKRALFKVNLANMEHELVFDDPVYDVDGALIYSPKNRNVIGINHIGGRIYWKDSFARLQAELDKALPKTSNTISHASRDELTYILFTQNDFTPGSYYLGNRKDNSLVPLFRQYPELSTQTALEHQLVTYTARDGVKIEGLLTLPNDSAEPVATVLFPHGGPGARDIDGFDYWTSFFVSRGYAVFRPNFRGSSGYGFEFASSQMGGWGLAMQDDLTDAAHWLIDKEITDPEKICIVGGSYGGYAALMGLAKTPDLFTCGVSFAGISSLKERLYRSRDYLNSKYFRNQLGTDTKDLNARSPLFMVDRITAPLLLVHGARDIVVDVKQSRLIADALEKAEKDFKYIEFDTGTHYLSIQRHRHELFRLMDEFLKQHLGEGEAVDQVTRHENKTGPGSVTAY